MQVTASRLHTPSAQLCRRSRASTSGNLVTTSTRRPTGRSRLGVVQVKAFRGEQDTDRTPLFNNRAPGQQDPIAGDFDADEALRDLRTKASETFDTAKGAWEGLEVWCLREWMD